MTLLLKQIFAFIKLLNSDTETHPLALGIVLGMFLGFTPVFSLQTVFVIFILFLFRIQIGAALVSAFFFAIPAYLLDPAFHQLGSFILERESLRPLFTTLYHMPLVPLTRFNNSVVMGSAIAALLLAAPVFVVSKKLIIAYRATVVARFKNTKLWKAVQATSFYQWYVKFEEYRG
ncbi:MAG: TIGR03546 family protein [Bdellovibrionales bacterium GWB1_55_8]|nr:MAG: TIGR03546 family protein [Bdellovibrionales bacterium GWB1_55_8]